MIDTRKIITSSLSESLDPLNDIFLTLNKRSGFKNSQSPLIPSYYYRYIGIEENENKYYEKLKDLDKRLKALDTLYLKLENGIPLSRNNDIIQKTEFIWRKYNTFLPNQKNDLLNDLREVNAYPHIKNGLLKMSAVERFIDIVNLYLANESNINITKIKNFCMKFFVWVNELLPKLFINFNLNNTNIISPKVLFYGDIKRHEIYFLTYLHLLGIDVIYINPNFDTGFNTSGRLQGYSKVIKLSKSGEMKKFPNYEKQKNDSLLGGTKANNVNANIKCNNELSKLDNKDSIKISLKTSTNPFEDIFTPVNHRAGYISSSTPFVPIYFYRYIGADKKEDTYNNELFNLDKKLSSLNNLYLKFTDCIPLVTNQNLVRKTQRIWTELRSFDNSKKDILINKLIQVNVFPDLKSELLNTALIKNFRLILNLYIEKESNLNLNKIKNFCLKLLVWINEYAVNTLRGTNYVNSNIPIKNPKVLYYGDIKKHEVYFLIYLSKMGFDILYINPLSDDTFGIIDKDELHSKALYNSNRIAIKKFPNEEVTVRMETVAYRASEEIGRIIHNEEDGVYKPWQFEDYKTSHVTLKSTHDELKILWNEESRMRTGFKIENGTVYIPNLFAKISGTYNDLSLYWSEVRDFKSSEHVLMFDNVPFTNSTYRKSDLYTCSSLIDNKGIIKRRLLQHHTYKYAHLKSALQDTIIDKINILLNSDILKMSLNQEFKLKIVITLLSLDERILKLIQRFDYPFKVPKVIIYDNNESMFNDEDSIVLAFLNLLGFDILILTPTGYNNIEQKIFNKYYDTHKLEGIKFDLELPNFNMLDSRKAKSFLKNIFGRSQ